MGHIGLTTCGLAKRGRSGSSSNKRRLRSAPRGSRSFQPNHRSKASFERLVLVSGGSPHVLPLKGREVDIGEDCTRRLVDLFVLPGEYCSQEVAILRVEAMPEDGVTLAVGQLVRVDEWLVEDKEPPVILEYVVFIFHAKP